MKQPVAGTTPAASYSPGMLASGRTLYVSGQGPLDGGEVVSGTIEQETQLTLENLARVLADGGATPADVVRVGIFLADLDEFDAMDAVYKRFFADAAPGAALPARTTVGAALRGIKVEIDCVAVLPDPEG
ncbi:RidA family protein [Conexibacter woesei]|uniref:Endoribonuclease L-PSP n=1 Tax=Conexibacter woesei (strain DSM 14684 / CCUG 47730 / CIP 108061 / JCM 11494 / NBRC 100937 / ID131577) TaxID=469383 RepID=D3FBA0_CONWI|nr:RidA family protein [Conexibacter woesei]ADB53292.1 Endoribonuclease L-PSP [Conexibacter woesei DSM 14684]